VVAWSRGGRGGRGGAVVWCGGVVAWWTWWSWWRGGVVRWRGGAVDSSDLVAESCPTVISSLNLVQNRVRIFLEEVSTFAIYLVWLLN